MFDAHILPTSLIYPGASGPRPRFDSPRRRDGNCCPTPARWPIVAEIEHVADVGATRSLCNIAGKTPRIGQQFPSRRRSEEHTSELQSRPHLVCRLLLEQT